MKRLLILFTAVALSAFFTGCELDDNDYSLDNAWVGFGLVKKEASAASFSIVMDDGEVLYPSTNLELVTEVLNNQRVLINFTILGNKSNPDHDEQYYVRINSLKNILYKGIFTITPEKEDSIGNDPISVKDKWIKNGILNFELKYYGGEKVHFVNLVKAPGNIDLSAGPVQLELRHNNNDDEGQVPLSAFVSFDLSALKVAGKTSTPFKITAKGFDGKTFEYTGEYKY